MTDVFRFGVSLDKELLKKFDKDIKNKKYPTRSKAIADLIRESLVKLEWESGKSVVGVITLVFDHHKRGLVKTLTDVQHDYHSLIISSQHIHLDHDNCLEIVISKGNSKKIKELSDRLKTTKGVKHCSLQMASTGEDI
ncbi:nickel-responsive transcriptional regulator NikR [bacterium]|nr:nickel-responsive transcriptional regulator NikR [bacterium]MCK5399252.1 nickel-responsive transcriptional regulator NikR [bacterium]